MGLLRLMGNKADVVKCCDENWSATPKSDIVGLWVLYSVISSLTLVHPQGLYLSDI